MTATTVATTPAANELVEQDATRLEPERQAGPQAGDGADPLDPVAMWLQVDVAEHAHLDAELVAQLGEAVEEGRFVAVPRGAAQHERQAEHLRLARDERDGQGVAVGAAAVGGRHGEQRDGAAAAGHRALQREVAVLATAPRGEESAPGDDVELGRLPCRLCHGAAPPSTPSLVPSTAPPAARSTALLASSTLVGRAPAGGAHAVDLEMVTVDRKAGLRGELGLERRQVAVAVEAHDATAEPADEGVAVADRRRRVAYVTTTVLNADEQTEVGQQCDGAVDRRLTDARLAQAVGRLGDRRRPRAQREELPDLAALTGHGNALGAKHRVDVGGGRRRGGRRGGGVQRVWGRLARGHD